MRGDTRMVQLYGGVLAKWMKLCWDLRGDKMNYVLFTRITSLDRPTGMRENGTSEHGNQDLSRPAWSHMF